MTDYNREQAGLDQSNDNASDEPNPDQPDTEETIPPTDPTKPNPDAPKEPVPDDKG